METIYKYELEITDLQEISIPDKAKILTVQLQHGTPCLWCLVNPEMHLRPYHIVTKVTGRDIEDGFNGEYVGTYQLKCKLADGDFVGHVFII